MQHDSISDLLTRIRNARMLRSEFVLVFATKITCSILELLQLEKLIIGFKFLSIGNYDYIIVFLVSNFSTFFINFKSLYRISKPSLKRFSTKLQNFSELSMTSNLSSVFIISTSYGLMTSKIAKELQIGGEILFQILF